MWHTSTGVPSEVDCGIFSSDIHVVSVTQSSAAHNCQIVCHFHVNVTHVTNYQFNTVRLQILQVIIFRFHKCTPFANISAANIIPDYLYAI